ncbi:DUF4159 domain-containing protein [Candidatus Poribacteria bacterium]|nr:DUF4159 domain-containing protein [Candidatus Poribacteria bacterium]MYB64298.1 DUF4159 domain-containing protein [Candidatus Poribacteria bacterium]
MSAKRTSGALMTSLLIHVVLILIAGVYFVTQTETFKDLVGVQFAKPPEPPKPKVRKPIVRQLNKPIVPVEDTVVLEQVQVQPRLTTAFAPKTTVVQQQTVLEFSNQAVKVDAPINPNVPKVVQPNVPIPEVVTHTELPVSDSPSALAFAGPAPSAPTAGPANIIRGVSGSPVQVKVTFQRSPGLAMVENVGVVRDALGDVAESITLGNVEVPPLPKGEPGGRVIGKGRDIRGVLRFTRIRHNLSDWWADASSLNALTKWLNEKTQIKTDMNVEGGALKFTDTNLLKTPIAFMTGHDPSLVRSRNLLGRQYGGGKMDSRLTQAEAAGLRKYLVEKGGFLIFDDCGVNAAQQAMIRLFLAQMRYVMPEHQIERVDNTHEIYDNFYQIGGPPVGFDIFWWGTRPPKRNFLEGFSIENKLSVLVVRRDYMCAMESVSLPTRSVHYSPGVYRFMTNVVVYALTHGDISDYSGYVPEDTLAKKELPTRAPEAAKTGATE